MGAIGRTKLRPTVILSLGLGVTSCGGSADHAAPSSGGATGSAATGTGGLFSKAGTAGSSSIPATVEQGSGGEAFTGVASLSTSRGGSVSASAGIANDAAMGGAVGGGGSASGAHSTAGGVLSGGKPSGGGSAAGGAALGGAAMGGTPATGGRTFGGASGGGTSAMNLAVAGRAAAGGVSGGAATTGGLVAAGAGTTGTARDPCSTAPRLSNATSYCNQNKSGSYGNYTWWLWSNQTTGCLTTYSGAGAAFSASWNNSGDFLARVGLSFDASRTFQALGSISAEFSENKSGDAGTYSYIGIYGLMKEPSVEFYIVEDAFVPPPIKVFSSKIGIFEVDGGTYDVYASMMSGTDAMTTRIFSVRQTTRQCGHISISGHFSMWAELGLQMGKVQEISLVVESGGGTGSIDFSTASVVVN